MKKSLLKQILVFLLSFGSLAVFSIAAETEYDCSEVAKQTKAAVSAKPGAAASTVTKMISKYENCVCSIVKAAIAGGGDVKDVVTAAVKAAPKQTAVVHECAVAASPKSSKAISAAIDAVMGSGDDFGTEPIVVSGVYLIAPVASAGGGSGFFGPLTAAELAAQQALIDRLLGRDTDTPSTPTDP
tara:strand:- start:303 stop:857 length:555 start_codon:yes stop_codon:yes gene_type:complete